MSWWKILGLGLAIILLLVILTAGSLRARFGHQLDAEIAAIKARGEPVTVEDLAREKIPANEDAAPLYEKVFQEMQKPDVLACQQVFDFFPSRNLSAVDQGTWAQARQAVSGSGPLISLLYQATSRPRCRFISDYSRGSLTLSPHLGKLRYLERTLRVCAVVHAKDGHVDRAVDEVRMQFRVAESLKDEPTSFSQFHRINHLAIAARGLENCLSFGDLNESQAKRLFDAMGEVDLADGFAKAYRGERVIFMQDFSHIKSSEIASIVDLGSGDSSWRNAKRRVLGTLHAGISVKGDVAEYLRYLGEQADATRLPYRELESKGLLSSEPNMPFYALLARERGGVEGGKGQATRFTATAKLNGDMVFLAILAYKSRTGRYPASLDEVRHTLHWKLLMDPYTDKDFKYRRLPKGFLLYSLGPNMKDDGGVQNDKRFFIQTETGDFVWKWQR
jgi:hypothetical protein